jgi:class 3 adenylate cyclase
MIVPLTAALALGLSLWAAPSARADAKSQAAKEVAEYVLQRFGRQAEREGTQALARRIEVAAARHGGEVFEAVRKVGPRALPLVEEAGAHGRQAARIMAQHGEYGVVYQFDGFLPEFTAPGGFATK